MNLGGKKAIKQVTVLGRPSLPKREKEKKETT